MTIKDKLIDAVKEKVALGYSVDEAVDDVLTENESTALNYVGDKLRADITRQQRRDWLKPKPYEQLTITLPDLPAPVSFAHHTVRTVDEDGNEAFKPARFSKKDEILTSHQDAIQEHYRLARNREKDHTNDQNGFGVLEAHGFDTDTNTIDEMKHAATTCFRCGGGYRIHDPFEVGHRISHAAGGDYSEGNLDWVHASCNRTQGTNPDTSAA